MSVLGPLLFVVFINDLPLATNFKVKLFAVDTLLSLDSGNYSDVQANVNKEINKVHKWLCANKLTLNIGKSKYMIVTDKNKPFEGDFVVKINKTTLGKCSSYKYLAVYINESLNWRSHINYLCEKIYKVCGIFAKLRHCVGFDILKMVYHALVASHLKYCNLIWGNASETALKPLSASQNQIIKITTLAPFSSHNVKNFAFFLGSGY